MLTFDEFHSACEGNALYQSLSEEEQHFMHKLSAEEIYRSGEHVFHSSENAESEFYIVEEGELILNLNSGKEKIYQKGDLFGEVSVLNGRPRLGTVRALSDAKLIKINGNALFDESRIPPKVALSILRGLANYVIGYLDEEYLHSTPILIQRGEGIRVEFKESLSKRLKYRVIETICAFLNSRGGSILVGVKDDGTISGINIESEKDIDHYKSSVIQILKKRIGSQFTTNINFNTDKIEGKYILRINVFPAVSPAIWEEEGKQIFYLRSGPTNITAPNIKEILNYYAERFVSK